ncbi:MAG: metallophosphoesterase [Chloroflexi bacterium]|nr:metallophosphoesterase [Chloroflexota bacterium]
MRKIRCLVIVLAFILLTGFSAAYAGGFSFVAVGDSRPSAVGAPHPWIYQRMLKEAGWLGVDLVLNTGDVVLENGSDLEKDRKAFKEFMDIHKPYPYKFYVAAGNHDYDAPEIRKAYLEIVRDKPYYSFNYEDAHFISLNTEMPGQERTISGDQWAWLKKDLEENKNRHPLFVFMHRPMYSLFNPNFDLQKKENFLNREERDKLTSLFTEYGVDTAYSGHEHSYHKEKHGGVDYIITGGGGAPLYGSPKEGGFYHYFLVTVGDKGKVENHLILPGQINVVQENDHSLVATNGTWEKVYFKGLHLPAPKGKFHLEADPVGWDKKKEYNAEVLENKDGMLTIGVNVPKNCNMRVTVIED